MEELLDFVPGGWPVAIAVGVGLVVLRGGLRPVAKGAVKTYLGATQGLRTATEGAREGLQDLYAEARTEADQARAESEAKRSARRRPAHEPTTP